MIDDELLFAHALNVTLGNEGVAFTNNPFDNGGPTRYGITLTTLEKYLSRTATADDVARITLDQASAIYRLYYWQPTRKLYLGKSLDVAAALFDSGVLTGNTRVVLCMQAALGVKADGIAGAETLCAMANARDSDFLPRYVAAHVDHFAALCVKCPSQLTFLRGWCARVMRYLYPAAAHSNLPENVA